jgi:DMSO/TMAO reductase YedYZ molybdopterin-dependent catalytic subunit
VITFASSGYRHNVTCLIVRSRSCIAHHPQTLLTFKISDEVLAPKYGYPLKLRIPTKLGFKNPKWIAAMYVTNRFPGGFWEDRGYNWFGGV